jgi:L-alanine-DL-glutamate epimerase-like enolase superfamily enzyme
VQQVRIAAFEIFAVDLPFRRTVEHSAAARSESDSIFLKCTADDGSVGFGECLPRIYVTGESRDDAYRLLRDRVLPRFAGMSFDSYADVWAFLNTCDGKAPAGWIAPDVPQAAAWCAVDLALLDTFGRAFRESVFEANRRNWPPGLRYGAVLTGKPGLRLVASCLLFRLYGLRQVKVKVGRDDDLASIRLARALLGSRANIRVDANMAWDLSQAAKTMREMSDLGVSCFEQPLPANLIEEAAQLVRETGCTIMADESFTDRESLGQLVRKRACTAINVRISKCGGLAASLRRCREAQEAGLMAQVGCQVGESSLLSAAQLALLSRFPGVACVEGCFGRHLLKEDIVEPVLQFRFGGRPPRMPTGTGLAVYVDERKLRRWARCVERIVIG